MCECGKFNNIYVGLCIRGVQVTAPLMSKLTIGVGLLIKGILLFKPVGGDKFVGIDLSLLHTVTTS